MALYRRGSVYWCRWRIGGEEIRETTGSSDPQEAQEYHDIRRAELWRSHRLGERRVTWDEAALDWCEQHAAHKRSYANDLLKIRWLQQHLSGRDIATITTDMLVQLRQAKGAETWHGRKVSPGTVNRLLATISAVLTYAAKRGHIVACPPIPYFAEAKDRIAWITQDEAQRLIEALPEHLAHMTRLALATGLRRANITGLEWSNVDLGRRVAWVWPDEAKAGRAIPIPLNDDAVEVLQERLGKDERWVFTYRGKPVMHTKTKAWDAACREAKIPAGFRFHDLRHTWATWHVQAGTPLEVLMKLGGWASYEMVLRYAHFAPGHLAEFADRVSSAHKNGHSAFDATAKSLNLGVADGIRTHDNWNHKRDSAKVVQLHQELTAELRAKRRDKTG